jgi:hypothetical protein
MNAYCVTTNLYNGVGCDPNANPNIHIRGNTRGETPRPAWLYSLLFTPKSAAKYQCLLS